MKYLVFKCGCKYDTKKVERDSSGKTCCPEHKGDIDYGEIICVEKDCDNIFKVGKKGMRANYCYSCMLIKRRTENNIRNKLSRRFPSSCKLNNNIVNMTYDEIAERLGISRQGVMQIENRALNKIRKQIELYPALQEYIREIGDIARIANDYYKRNPVIINQIY